MSIMTWKFYAEDETKPGLAFYPLLVINYPSTQEMQGIIADLADHYARNNIREGYDIKASGSCCKGPQGINWKMRITFEGSACEPWLARFKSTHANMEEA